MDTKTNGKEIEQWLASVDALRTFAEFALREGASGLAPHLERGLIAKRMLARGASIDFLEAARNWLNVRARAAEVHGLELLAAMQADIAACLDLVFDPEAVQLKPILTEDGSRMAFASRLLELSEAVERLHNLRRAAIVLRRVP